jgi:hypothetical protein
MKSALFRRVLFAVVVVAGCGDKPQPTKSEEAAAHVVPVQPSVAPAPAPVPVVKSELPQPVPTDFADAMKLGKAAAGKNDVDIARAMFDAASRFDGTSAEPQIELARLFIASGDKKLALASAKKATKLAPESSATIVGPSDVADVYDVVGMISTATGAARFTLADGGTLAATYNGNLAACATCALTRLGPRLQRLQVEATAAIDAGGLHISSSAVSRRLRWDLYIVD